MTDQLTPETDALEDSLVAQDKQYPESKNAAFVEHCVEQLMAQCRALEIQRNAAREERDALQDQVKVRGQMRDDAIQEMTKKIIERNALRADVARLRTALEGMLIAEMAVRQMDGFSADEVETEPHWMAARAALDTPAQ